MTRDQRFPYLFDNRYLPVFKAFGVGSDDAVIVDEETFTATYGWLRFTTPMSNVAGGHITENYRWWTAVGVRLSLVDDGLTFGTNHDRGVCVHFNEPVQWKVPFRSHHALTVTVKDCEGLVEAIGRDEPSNQ